jgi:hypothetical protein
MPRTFNAKIMDPGEWAYLPDEHEDPRDAIVRAREGMLRTARRLGARLDKERHGVQAGEHITLVVAIILGTPGAIWACIQIGQKLKDYLAKSRKRCGSREFRGEANIDALEMVAYAELRRKDPKFMTDPELVQRLQDGERWLNDKMNVGMDWRGFPAGVYLFRIPDLTSRTTYTIEIRSDGKVLSCRRRPGLTSDAKHYLEAEDCGARKPSKRVR